jgi:hypothetical protein
VMVYLLVFLTQNEGVVSDVVARFLVVPPLPTSLQFAILFFLSIETPKKPAFLEPFAIAHIRQFLGFGLSSFGVEPMLRH